MTNQALHERRKKAVMPAIYSTHPFYPERAVGSYVWDVEGHKYLDWTVGIAVMNIGHSHPKVVAAVKEQVDKFQHMCFAVAMHETFIHLAEKLTAIFPGQGEARAFLINSGAECVENAVKIARVHTKRQGIVTFTHAFHGRTHMALSLTGKVNPYKAGFAPRAAEVYRAQYPYTYRNAWGTHEMEACGDKALEVLRDQIKYTVGESEIAAFIIEPVAGEGGFIPAPANFLKGLHDYAKEIGALWIDDEVQAGIGRTGKWWTVDNYGLEPDIICTAKALSSGFPLSAVVVKSEIADTIQTGQLGSTFGGNPAACAAAIATLEVIEEENLLERANIIGAVIKERMHSLQKELPQLGDVRGIGAMIGLEFVKDPESKEPHKEAVEHIVSIAREHGLLLLSTGTYGNTIRLLPPINMSDSELSQGLDVLEKAIRQALR